MLFSNLNIGEMKILLTENENYVAQRPSWNGKRMFIFRLPEFITTSTEHPLGFVEHFILNNIIPLDYEAQININPTYCMFTADKRITVGWLANQTDLDAEDWQVFSCASDIINQE